MKPQIYLVSDFLSCSLTRQLHTLAFALSFIRRPVSYATEYDPHIFLPLYGQTPDDLLRQSGARSSFLSLSGLHDANFSTLGGHNFSAKRFFSLSGIERDDSIEQLFYFSFDDIKHASLQYLGEYFHPGDIVIGEELTEAFCKCLKAIGVISINLWMHPVRFMDDLLYAVSSSDERVYDAMTAYHIDEKSFWLHADYLKLRLTMGMPDTKCGKLLSHAALFVGQLANDHAVCDRGRMLSVLDFKTRFEALGQRYAKVYYSMHPEFKRQKTAIHKYEEIRNYLASCPFVETVENISSYHMLCSGKIEHVAGISSSLLDEAQYFGLTTEYWYKPMLQYGSRFGEEMLSVGRAVQDPQFWADALAPLMPTIRCNANVILPVGHNMHRDAVNAYWGYARIDPLRRLESTVKKSVARLFLNRFRRLYKAVKTRLFSC